MCDAVEKSGCVYAYGENYCFSDSAYATRKLCEEKLIGSDGSISGTGDSLKTLKYVGVFSFDVKEVALSHMNYKYRNDHYCTDPRTDEKFRLPTTKNGTPDIDESVYEKVQKRFVEANLKPGMN
ncbi:MAG: hypothetical protein II998_01530 [Clostridia bacterium]|nr:hypothetical protein [Clostridia bacterium]